MSDKDSLLAQFQDVTGADVDRANFFLESSGWNLDVALENFLDTGAEATPNQGNAPQTSQPSATPTSARPGNYRVVESDDDDSDSDMEEGQAFYAGGSDTSGQQILGPPKKREGRDFVKELFKKAREHGAEAVDPSQAGTSGGRQTFVGTGFRLGSNDAPSQTVGRPAPEPQAKPREFALKMWRDGFSIDDGDLRNYDDPGNREFLMSVMSGRIPRELITEARGGEVHVNMEDHKDEEFKKPKPVVKPFQGAGFVLGAVVPDVEGAPSATATPVVAAALSGGEDQMKDLEEKAQAEIGVNTSADLTTIQVRLPDGRLLVKLNTSHSVGDLRRYIQIARPTYSTFSLLTTFPKKELTDDNQSLKEAGLLNSAILLRAK